MTTGFLQGTRLVLRELTRDEIIRCHRWMNNPEVTRGIEAGLSPQSIERLTNDAAAAEFPAALLLAIVLREGERHIGTVRLGPIDWINRRADATVIIGETDQWRRGYASEAIGLIAEHAFRALSLHKVTASCPADNPAAVEAFRRAGFVVEGVRPQQYFRNGRPIDEVLLGRLESASERTARA